MLSVAMVFTVMLVVAVLIHQGRSDQACIATPTLRHVHT